MDKYPSNRPSFAEIIAKLGEIAAQEPVESNEEDGTWCVICLAPCKLVGLVHAADNE